MTYDMILEKTNNNKYLKINGISITFVREGQAEGEVIINEQHMNPMGIIHGGLIFTLMDTLATCAAITRGQYVSTSNGNIHFLNHTNGVKKIKGIAKELKNGKNLLVHEVTAFDEKDRLISKATFTNFKMNESVSL